MRFTDEQQQAIEARGENLLLSAAAGSGKTATLVERVLQLTVEGADIDRMLVVTFTRAAAADMREKLTRALSERAAAGDARMREQLVRLERAPITTLHAFCADFLRENFEAADVDPAFLILDESDARLMRDAALDEALEAGYEEGGAALEAFDYGRGPAGVREAADALMHFLDSRPDPDAWLETALSMDGEAWAREIVGAARRAIGEAHIRIKQALLYDLPPHYITSLTADLEALEQMRDEHGYERLRAMLTDFKLTSPRGRNAGYDPEAIAAAKKLREDVRDLIGRAAIIQLPIGVALPDSLDTLVGARALAKIAREAARIFGEMKAERGALTYTDLETYTLAALSDDLVADAARARYTHVFVDEYQDTSDVQDAIVRRVSGADNLFMVGDVKQSIYRFRQAEPRLFLEKYEAYARGAGGRLLPLTRNFRSNVNILDFTNAVFERLLTGGDSEIEYDALARLRPGEKNETPGHAVEIHIIEGAGDDELSAAEREGLMIAGEIKRMMAEDASLRYRDFAILTRQGARAFSALIPMLVSEGIPAYADGGAGYFDALEVRLALALLRLIDNLHSDEDLIAALRSPVCALTLEELAQIRLVQREGAYADAALACAEGEGALSEKLRAFLNTLDLWRLKAGAMALDALLRAVIDESGIYAYAGALPGGAQRQANLDMLIVRAGAYDRDVSGSLNRFLTLTDGMRARGAGDSAQALGEADDVVRLMTIHHSKGLEFKVVFGARLATKTRTERAEDSVLCHPQLGIGLMKYDPALRSRRNTLSRAAIAARANREGQAEELRVLYVLMTRAMDRLVLTGSLRDLETARARWRAASESPALAGSMLDMVLSALGERALGRMTVHAAADFTPPGLEHGQAEITVDPAAYDPQLAERYRWEYPHRGAERMPIKLTASGLLRGIDGPANLEPLAPRPLFLQEGGMTAAERGTAYHRAMQLIDIRALDGMRGMALTSAIKGQIDDFANRALMTEEEHAAVSAHGIARFFESDIGLRLRAAREVMREQNFNLILRADEALAHEEAPGAEGAGELLVQGTIDLCFLEAGEWVLIDYKTSRADDLDAIRAHYARQLALYAKALERITGLRVKERVLCLIGQGVAMAV
ncbi:MAG: UvrD-helicase domain-containing protein [Christensenellales bacterium]|jgi:ATP-dependent helicase/nuclease subunit A